MMFKHRRNLLHKRRKAQSDVIAVVILVGVSLVVGLSIVALFTSQSAIISSDLDVSDAVAAERSKEFITLVYHDYCSVSGGYNHTLMFKLISLSHSGRDYFLVLPLITLGDEPNAFVEGEETQMLLSSIKVAALGSSGGSTGYSMAFLPPENVDGEMIYLSNGMRLSGLGNFKVYRIDLMDTPPYPSTYLLINFVAPPEWVKYDFTLYSLIQVGSNYYVVEGVSTPLEVRGSS